MNTPPASASSRSLSPTLPPWDKGLLCVLLLSCLILLLPGGADPDLWGHIQFGRDVVASGIPETTSYSYTAENYPWINHEHLSELWFAWVDEHCGAIGLQLTRVVLAAVVLGLTTLLWRQAGVEFLPLAVSLVLATANLKYHWSIRPQLFTYTLFFLLLAFCDVVFADWAGRWHLPWWPRRDANRGLGRGESLFADERRSATARLSLWLLVPLFLVWVNTHGGFAAGMMIALVYLGSRSCELWLVHRSQSLQQVTRIGLIVGALVLVAFINPYGYRLPLWLSRIGIARPEITEWHGLDWSESFTWLYVALLGLTVASYYYSRRPLDFTHLLITLLVTGQAVSHRRHIAFATLLFLLWLPSHLQDVWQQLKARYAPKLGGDVPAGANLDGGPELWSAQLPATPTPARWPAIVTWSLACVLTGWLGWRASDIRVWRNQYPVGAMEFITEHHLGGNLVVAFNWAQYALAAVATDERSAPTTRIAFDGRFTTCYPESVLDAHFDFLLGMLPGKRSRSQLSPPFDPDRMLELGNPDLVLVDRKQPHSCQVVRRQGAEWSLLYRDAICELWGRSTQYDDPTSPTYLPPQDRELAATADSTWVSWPAIPHRYLNHPGRLDSLAAPAELPVTLPVSHQQDDARP